MRKTRSLEALLVALPALAASACLQAWECSDGPDCQATPPNPATTLVAPDTPGAGPTTVSFDIADKPLLRLTYRQVSNAIRDVLGYDSAPIDLLPGELAEESYYNAASAQVPNDLFIDGLAQLAEQVASAMIDDPVRRVALLQCTPTTDAADPCLSGFVDRVSKRLYRRPLASDDLAALVTFARTGAANGWEAARVAIEVMLEDPRFLYRIEPTSTTPERPGYAAYDDYAMASRLALTIQNTVPDELLLAAADSGTLHTPEQLAAQADRLLADPSAAEGAREFYRQWLDLDAILKRSKNATAYPTFTPALASAMQAESMALLDEFAAKDVPLLDVLTADHTYVNAQLASLYGLPAPPASSTALVQTPLGPGRLGFLGHGSFLANDAKALGTSPTHRGLFVIRRLLCGQMGNAVMSVPVPDPTPNVPKTTRQEMELVHAVGSCQGCHKRMDGIGFGFEGFDGIGASRTTENGLPIDDSGVLELAAKDVPFLGEPQLAQALRNADELSACLVHHHLRWSLGRDLVDYEAPAAAEIAKQFATTTGSYVALLKNLVQSDFFRLRPLAKTDPRYFYSPPGSP